MDKRVGKKIYAGEKIYQFSTGECVGWTRRRNIGVITEITDEIVYIHDKKNPTGYKDYTLKRCDFEKWCQEKLYVLR